MRNWLAVFLFAVILSGCSKSPAEKLIGYWEPSKGGPVQFTKDGMMVLAKDSCYYSWVGDTQIKIYGKKDNPDFMSLTWLINFVDTDTLELEVAGEPKEVSTRISKERYLELVREIMKGKTK